RVNRAPERGGGREETHETRREVNYGPGHCKWFNVRMGFGFLAMTSREGCPVDPPLDVFVHQSKLHMEGFRSLREGEPVEFTFQKSSKGLESLWVTGPGGGPCLGNERRPKGKSVAHKRKQKGDRCYNCGGLDHHAKECTLPPLPKKCHYCQSVSHMVAHCPLRASTPPTVTQGRLSTRQHASTSSQTLSSHTPEASSTQDTSPLSKSSSSSEDRPQKPASARRRKTS
uniref:Uncharacterized protein n=1 Tax=Denticeps clupeoides TaxID=299321 RepID=A0AAY4D499_9TELE